MKEKTPEYKIIQSDDSDELSEAVSHAMSEGWNPVGGVSVSQSDFYSVDHHGFENENYYVVFAQAVTRRP